MRHKTNDMLLTEEQAKTGAAFCAFLPLILRIYHHPSFIAAETVLFYGLISAAGGFLCWEILHSFTDAAATNEVESFFKRASSIRLAELLSDRRLSTANMDEKQIAIVQKTVDALAVKLHPLSAAPLADTLYAFGSDYLILGETLVRAEALLSAYPTAPSKYSSSWKSIAHTCRDARAKISSLADDIRGHAGFPQQHMMFEASRLSIAHQKAASAAEDTARSASNAATALWMQALHR